MTLRCRYSDHGLSFLRRKQREGTLIREMRTGRCLVLWDGLKCATAYHASFIDVLEDPDLLEERVRPADELRIRRAPSMEHG